MRSTFMGLETNKRGLYTQQSGLYTTGHNISNANTKGYSRQRVNMQATGGYPGVGLNAGTMPGFIGTGVEAGSITRVRDTFVDHQFRQESNKLGYWEAQSKAISQMEDVLNEPSHYGLQKSFSEFWRALQDVATNPSEAGARSVAVRKGEAVADSFNYMHKSLTEIQTNLGLEIKQSEKTINSILTQITHVNEQIKNIEPNGYIPNDLYDRRDLLLDELSEYIPIEVGYEWSGGRAVMGEAEGWAVVKLKREGQNPITLVHGTKAVKIDTTPSSLVAPNGDNLPIGGVVIKNALDEDGEPIPNPNPNADPDSGANVLVSFDNLSNVGKLKSLMDAYGTSDGKGLYPEMLAELDKMAKEFAEAFNGIYNTGEPLPGKTKITDFFVDTPGGITAGTLTVNEAIIKDPNAFLASSDLDEAGNGENAQKLSEIQFQTLGELDGATLETYFQGVIGELGVKGLESNKMEHNTATLLGAVEHRRASISSVSLDEELTDMIKFQQAYNASARMITVVDETLDKIINGMGVVGR